MLTLAAARAADVPVLAHPVMPLSEFEFHEVTNELEAVTIGSPPVRRLGVSEDARTGTGYLVRESPPGSGAKPQWTAAMRLPFCGSARFPPVARRGVPPPHPRSAAIRAQHRTKSVRVGAAESPGHLRAHAKRLATALHLPAVDPDRHAHTPESGRIGNCWSNRFRFCRLAHLLEGWPLAEDCRVQVSRCARA